MENSHKGAEGPDRDTGPIKKKKKKKKKTNDIEKQNPAGVDTGNVFR